VGDGGVAGTNSSRRWRVGEEGGHSHRGGEDEILERRAFINSLF
jgi:hypothetical protein